jgi:hypothetical protein
MRMKRLSVLLFSISMSGFASIVYNGGTGIIVMGVSPYAGAPNVGGPTYIANNFTGFNDILTSPGLGTLGGTLTADPVVANNIYSVGPVTLPQGLTETGGGNGSGMFGAGSADNGGNSSTFALWTPERAGAVPRT